VYAGIPDGELLEKMGMKQGPEAEVWAAITRPGVELVLGPALGGMPELERWRKLAFVEWSQDDLPVGEQQRIPDIEEHSGDWRSHAEFPVYRLGGHLCRLRGRQKKGNISVFAMGLVSPTFLGSMLARTARLAATLNANLLAFLVVALQYPGKKGDAYNVLWALVFGFATLNILGLVARRLEPRRSRISFGELVAVMVVLVSFCLLGWEMLYLFHVLPIKLTPPSS
jgi:hypothetical protein